MDWKVFQTDVLDALKQYEGFFDFFERTGTLSDRSRPDCIARITRENKKIYIFDAKNKDEIDEEDEKRMEKYIDQIKDSPMDIGLEFSEIGSHEVQGIFITRGEASSGFKTVESKKLHQFLRKEVVYTETNRVVRDVAQMTEKGVLTHSQARMLYRSLEDFRSKMDRARKLLKNVEHSFTGLKLKEPPIENRESLPVDFMLEHPERPSVFVDVPYNESKPGEMEKHLEDEAIYVSLGTSGDYGCSFDNFERHLMTKLQILPWERVAEFFTPKIPTERKFESSRVVIRDTSGAGFKAEIRSFNDTRFKVEAEMPEEVLQRVRDQALNSRKEFCEPGGSFRHSFKVKEGLKIDYGTVESFDSYLDTVNTVYRSAVNPVLSRRVNESRTSASQT